MVLPVILAAVLTQNPAPSREVIVVSIARPQLIAPELALQLEQLVRTTLTEASVPQLSPEAARLALEGQDPLRCETNRACFALLGRAAGTFGVVRVEGSVLDKDVAVFVQALQSAGGAVIREESFVVAIAEVERQVPVRIARLASEVHNALPPPVTLTPAKVAAVHPAVDQLATPAPAAARRGVPIWVTGGGAVVMAGAAVGLFAVGASARSCLNGPTVGGAPTVCVPEAQVAGVQQRADVEIALGAGAAALAVGLAATAVVQWALSN